MLQPTPTLEDIKRGVVGSFEFVSWHEPTQADFQSVKKTSMDVRVTPTQIKKAQSLDRAFTSRKHTNLPDGSRAGALPDHEGFPFDWSSHFWGSHHRNPAESDVITGNDASMDEIFMLCKSLAAGERWVTAHPNGEGTKGVPILIQEHPDGTASVIGGAGGKLNHLKLRGIRPASDYKGALKEKHQARQAAKKEQIRADKEAGIHDAKEHT